MDFKKHFLIKYGRVKFKIFKKSIKIFPNFVINLILHFLFQITIKHYYTNLFEE